MAARTPSPEQLARYVDAVRGIERIVLRKAPRLMRGRGLTHTEALDIAELLAHAATTEDADH